MSAYKVEKPSRPDFAAQAFERSKSDYVVSMREAIAATSRSTVDVVGECEDRLPHPLIRVSREFQFRLFGREVVFFNKKSVKVDRDAFLDGKHGVSGADVSHSPIVGAHRE